MEWNEELISRLRALWQEGLSTAEIGRQLEITKNAVVGKAHRLGLPPRPSPIRRQPENDTGEAPVRAARPVAPKSAPKPAVIAEAAPAAVETVAAQVDAAPVAEPVVAATPAAPPQPVAAAPAPKPAIKPVAAPIEASRPALRAVSAPSQPRRSGLTCCWPLGEPGTKGFHFCGGHPIPGKPYCSEHAQLAYVKLRDRRDNVA